MMMQQAAFEGQKRLRRRGANSNLELEASFFRRFPSFGLPGCTALTFIYLNKCQ